MVDDIALETACSHRGDGPEFVGCPKQVFTRLDGPGAMDNLLKTLDFVWRQASWKAKLTQCAPAACNLSTGGFTPIIADISYS